MLLFGPVKLAWSLVRLVITAAVVYVVVTGVQVVLASRATTTSTAKAAAVLVLPGATSLTRDARARLSTAASLATSRHLDVVVAGVVPNAHAATDLAGRVSTALAADGVARAAIHVATGRSTAASLAAAAALVGTPRRVLVVDDAINALFAAHAVGAAGLDPVAVLAPPHSRRPAYDEIGSLVHATAGVAIGRIVGFANTPVAPS